MSFRIERINSLIQQELSKIIIREIEIPEGSLATITEVETSADLAQAKVWLSIFPTESSKKIFHSLNKKIGYFQGLLIRKLVMKPVPKIKFVLDTGETRADQVEKLLDQIS